MSTRFLRIRPFLCSGWLLIATVCGPPPAARADDASKAAVIDELFEVMHVDGPIQLTVRQSVVAQKSTFEQIEPFKSNKAASAELLDRITALLSDKLSWSKLKPGMVKLYADTYTEDELAAFLAFYKSPAGQAMLKKSPVISAGTAAIVQRQIGGLTPDITRLVQDVVTKYLKPKNKLDDD